MIYVNKIENRIIYEIKIRYYIQILTPQTMKLLGSTKSKITKDKDGENMPHLEITEVVLKNCIIINNNYQQDSRVLFTFIPNKSFDLLLHISSKNFILKTLKSRFSKIEVLFIDQNSKPLEI